MNFTIRPMQLEDIVGVQQVAENTWHATYENIIPRNIQDNFLKVAYNSNRLKIRMKNGIFHVAEMDNKVIGFVNFTPVQLDGRVELNALYVLPPYQGNGIGSAFLKHVLNEFQEISKIFLNVEKNNEIGKNFYLAQGFEQIDQFDDNFDGHILKTLRMVLNVPPKTA